MLLADGTTRLAVWIPGSSTVAQLKDRAAEITRIPIDQFRLLYNGAIIKDQHESVSFFTLPVHGQQSSGIFRVQKIPATSPASDTNTLDTLADAAVMASPAKPLTENESENNEDQEGRDSSGPKVYVQFCTRDGGKFLSQDITNQST